MGTLKPNDLGLFDVHGDVYGNVWKWCQEALERGGTVMDSEIVQDKTGRVLRSGVFANQPRYPPHPSQGPARVPGPHLWFPPGEDLQLSPFTTYPPSAGWQ